MFHDYENDQQIFERLLHYTNATFKHHNVSYNLSNRTDLNIIIILFNLPNTGDSYKLVGSSKLDIDVTLHRYWGNPANELELFHSNQQ